MSYTELIEDLKKGGFEILVDNTISSEHKDSFFYDGLVLSFKKGRYTYSIEAVGDIRIENKKGEVVYHNHRNYDDLIKVKNDSDLSKICEPKYLWENNNWFEFLILDTNFDDYIDDMGEVFGCLDDFFNLAEYVNEVITEYEKEEVE